MAMYHRVGFTAAQSAELWERWKKGEGLKSIGRAFGKPSSCVFAHLRVQHGNRYRRLLLRPAKPLAARLKRKHQSPAAPVLPQGPRPRGALPGRTEQGGAPAQRAAEENAGLPVASRTI